MGMWILGVVLLVLAALGFFVACVSFSRGSRQANSDLMGATVSFDSPWFVASIFLAIGLTILAGTHWAFGIGTAVASIAIGWLFKSYVLDHVLRRVRKRR